MIRKLLVVFVSAFFCHTAFGQTLWRETTFGMTIEQVMIIVPEAVPVTEGRNTLHGGAQELLRISGFEIVDQQFTARFFFKEQKLTQVMLALENPHSYQSTLRVFEAITEALRAKYGPELSRRISDTPIPAADATWLSGRTNIGVTVMAVPATSVLMNINYQVRVALEADKL